MKRETILIIFITIFSIVFFVGAIFGVGYLYRHYSVWASGMKGQAELNEAEWNRQIQIAEAEANLEAQRFNAQSEIERAKGVAEANKIIDDSLKKGGDKYLQYLAIQAQMEMADSPNNTVIYIPSGLNGIPMIKTIE